MVESENRAHLFQLKTEPQFYPGLHFIGKVTLPSAQDSVSICLSHTYSQILSGNDEYETACDTILTTVLLQDPGDSRVTLKMRTETAGLFLSLAKMYCI